MSNDLDIQALLRAYAPPAPDNGFTAATLARDEKSKPIRILVLSGAALVGGAAALSQLPVLWDLARKLGVSLGELKTPLISPYAVTLIGVLSFVGWAALDRGWSDTI